MSLDGINVPEDATEFVEHFQRLGEVSRSVMHHIVPCVGYVAGTLLDYAAEMLHFRASLRRS